MIAPGRPKPSFRVAVLMFSFFALALLLVEAVTSKPAPDSIAFVELTVEHPRRVSAGESFDVTVHGVGDDKLVRLSLDAGYGPRTIVAVSESDRAYFSVPPATEAESGTVLLDVDSTTGRATSTIEIDPTAAAGPLDLYLGPRTLETGSGDVAMLVAVPTDQRGNPVDANTAVEFRVRRPTAEIAESTANTRGLLGILEVPAQTAAGRTTVTATVNEATGPPRTFDEVAALAEPFDLSLDTTTVDAQPVLFANGQELVSLTTSVLVDRFGNQLPDGTIGHLESSGATGPRRISSLTIDGRLSFVVEAPATPGDVRFHVVASGGMSNELVVNFGRAVADIPVVLRHDRDATRIDIGPVLSPDGAFVPDGTVVETIVDGHRFAAFLEQGKSTVSVPRAESVSVTVLGVVASTIEDLR